MKNSKVVLLAINGLGASAFIYSGFNSNGLSLTLSLFLSSICVFFSLFLAYCFYTNSSATNTVKKITLVSLFLSACGVLYYSAKENLNGGYDLNMTTLGYVVIAFFFIALIYKLTNPNTDFSNLNSKQNGS